MEDVSRRTKREIKRRYRTKCYKCNCIDFPRGNCMYVIVEKYVNIKDERHNIPISISWVLPSRLIYQMVWLSSHTQPQ